MGAIMIERGTKHELVDGTGNEDETLERTEEGDVRIRQKVILVIQACVDQRRDPQRERMKMEGKKNGIER